MTTKTNTGPDAIRAAETTLSEVLDSGLRERDLSTANSLDRILTHLRNMRPALETTPGCQVNVAKRLRDFSVTTARMAANFPQSSSGFEKLAAALREAADRVATDAQPAEAAPRADAA